METFVNLAISNKLKIMKGGNPAQLYWDKMTTYLRQETPGVNFG